MKKFLDKVLIVLQFALVLCHGSLVILLAKDIHDRRHDDEETDD